MKKNNKGKKRLAAVSAVVAAGLTPGAIVASAAGLPIHGSDAGITAADVVSIDGTTYSFDELYAIQRDDTVETVIEMPDITLETTQANLYGPRVFTPQPAEVDRNFERVYNDVEQMPQFPGGNAALKKYIKSHINYPAKAAQNNVQGNVVVQFVVRKDGDIDRVSVVSPVDEDLDREAVRVVELLPKFTPGRQNGEAVNVRYTVSVPFELK
ncbi:MAG: energy transducer TonB [Muribaculaceae bacterium]|nr:energy transducer TonB [Muribaculaceae bacterium]